VKAKWLTIAYIVVAALLILYLVWTLTPGKRAGRTASRPAPAAFASFHEPGPAAAPVKIFALDNQN